MNTIKYLRNYIREVLTNRDQGALVTEAALNAKELAKRNNVATFLTMMKDGSKFTIEKDDKMMQVTIPDVDNKKLVKVLGDKVFKPEEYKSAFPLTAYLGKKKITVTSPAKILKTFEFGGTGGSESAAAANESGFVAIVNELIKNSEDSVINVQLGKQIFTGVTLAAQTGQQRSPDGSGTYKPDVMLTVKAIKGKKNPVNPVGLSFKLDTADYYLSGDDQLGDIAKKILDAIAAGGKNGLPGVSIQQDVPTKKGDGTFPNALTREMEQEDGTTSRVPIDIQFELTRDVAKKAVLGPTDKNKVDFVVKGNLNVQPKELKPGLYSWEAAVTDAEADFDELLKDPIYGPVGLLRHDTTRGVGGYKGIRPAVATRKRAKNALKADDLIAKIKDFKKVGLREPKGIRLRKEKKDREAEQAKQQAALQKKGGGEI